MTTGSSRPGHAASSLFGAARVALGVLWLHEGLLKHRAGFGRADIQLVVDSAGANTRVPGWFTPFTDDVLGRWPSAFGVAVPIVEVALGLALVAGVLTLPGAVLSSVTLTTYWSADQLIDAYPAMFLLSALIAAWPIAAGWWSLPRLVEGVRHRMAAGTDGVSAAASRHRPRGSSR